MRLLPTLLAACLSLSFITCSYAADDQLLQHQGEQGPRLAKLASLRYLPERELSVAEQMRQLGLEPSVDRTYRNWVQRLHDRMIAELSRRSERRGT
jgi:hypothetical protein